MTTTTSVLPPGLIDEILSLLVYDENNYSFQYHLLRHLVPFGKDVPRQANDLTQEDTNQMVAMDICSNISTLKSHNAQWSQLIVDIITQYHLPSLIELGLTFNLVKEIDSNESTLSPNPLLGLSHYLQHNTPNLTSLSLKCGLPRALSDSSTSRIRLILDGNHNGETNNITDEPPTTPTTTTIFPHLISLQLQSCHLLPCDMSYLAGSTSFPSLKHIDLSDNQVFLTPISMKHFAHDFLINSAPQVNSIKIDGCGIDQTGFGLYFSTSPALSKLKMLDLSNCNHLTNYCLITLLKSPHFAQNNQLEVLILQGNTIEDPIAHLFQTLPPLSSLKELNLANCNLTDDGLESIVTSQHLVQLGKLNVGSNHQITPQGFLPLAHNSPHLSTLTHLNISQNSNTSEILYNLGRSSYLINIDHLDLSYCDLSDTDYFESFLVTTESFTNLQHLDLRECIIEPESLVSFIQSELSINLVSLQISSCYVMNNDDVIESFFHINSSPFTQLEFLSLVDTNANDETLIKLARCPSLSNLVELNMGDCYEITDQGFIALINSPYFLHINQGRLTKLQFFGTSITNDSLEALSKSPIINQLTYLDLRGTSVDNIGKEMIMGAGFRGEYLTYE